MARLDTSLESAGAEFLVLGNEAVVLAARQERFVSLRDWPLARCQVADGPCPFPAGLS